MGAGMSSSSRRWARGEEVFVELTKVLVLVICVARGSREESESREREVGEKRERTDRIVGSSYTTRRIVYSG